MLCPNCGYNQQEGNVCGECHTLLKSVSPPSPQGIEQGWKKPKPVREISPKGAPEKIIPKHQQNQGLPISPLKENPKPQETPKNIEPEREVKEVKKIEIKEKEIQADELTTPYQEGVSVSLHPEEKEDPQRGFEVEERKSVSFKVRRPQDGKESPLSMSLQKLQEVLVTTTETLEGEKIHFYRGLVHADAAIKLDSLETILSSIKEVGGLRNTSFQDLLNKAIAIATSDLKIEAVKLNANAIVGVRFQYEQFKKEILVVHVMGTAVQTGGPPKESQGVKGHG